jgi:hypothetical protein
MAMYSAPFNAVAVTAQQDLFEVNVAADSIVVIHCLELSQSTEVGDAQEEGLNLLFKRGATTSGSGGSTVTPVATPAGEVAYGGTVEANNTTKATGGTNGTIRRDIWNVRSPYLWLPPPELRLVLSPSARFTVELATTPADSITMSGCLWLEELGG